MKIIIETIPHETQRYPTVGDWFFEDPKADPKDTVLHINVSRMSDWRYEMLVAIHEAVEVLCCLHAGVGQEEVDKFDMNYEANRKPGDNSEPGDCPVAPYFRQHVVASGVERLVAGEMDVDWEKYADEIESLP